MHNADNSIKNGGSNEGDYNEVGKDLSTSDSSQVCATINRPRINADKIQNFTSLPTSLIADLSESDDDDVSEVESFILDHPDLDEESSKYLLSPVSPDLRNVDPETQARIEALLAVADQQVIEEETSKFLLSSDSADIRQLDPVSQARIEALLEATGINTGDPEVLRKLTSSVSCALDEAAACLTRMRSEHPQGDDEDTNIMQACQNGSLEQVQMLLEEIPNQEFYLNVHPQPGDQSMKDTTPLMEAAGSGHTEIVKLLIRHGADVNVQTSQGNTALMYACAAGREEVVEVLLANGANVEVHNENGHTPLMEAASAGHVGVARLLVHHGAPINTHSNEFKESALTLACYKGHLEMVRFLLSAGADQEHKTDEMHTALMEASMDGHVEVARLLLDSGAQVNMPADSFESPLTLAACGGHTDLALLLLERGASIEEVNDEGYTPLMEAAREGHEEMVALLLSQGADINAQTEETQETALTLACCGGFLEVTDFLIKSGADIELGASTPLMEAAQEGHLELVRYLIKAGCNVNAQTSTGDTALTYACENGHTDVADLLLQAGAELEHESEGGRTPLMKATRAGHLCTVQFLIARGANVNKQTANNDHTPLSLACAGGHLQVVELLLAHGADPGHKLKDNSTMLIEAAKGGHTSVVQLLLDYPSNISPPPPPDLVASAQPPCPADAPRVPPHGVPAYLPHELPPHCAYAMPPQTSRVLEAQHLSASSTTALPTNLSKQSLPKSLQRKAAFFKSNEAPSSAGDVRPLHKAKSNASAQANSLNIQAETGRAEAGGGGSIDKLEALSSMMKKVDLVSSNREEQILHKQHILEELQRVERELQEKTHSRIFSTTQPTSQPPPPPTTSSPAFLINSALLDVNYPPSLDLGHFGLNMPRKGIDSSAAAAAMAHYKSRTSKHLSKVGKSSKSQQYTQQQPVSHQQPSKTTLPPPTPLHSDEVEKMNLRNVVLSEQQQQQQHLVLSELTHSLSFRSNNHLPEATADALALMQAAGNLKFTSDKSQGVPLIDPLATNALGPYNHQLQQLEKQQRILLNEKLKVQKNKIPKTAQLPPTATQLTLPTQTLPTKVSSFPEGDNSRLISQLNTSDVLSSTALPSLTFAANLSNTTTTYSHSLAVDDGLMVAAPARSLHDALGEIMSTTTTNSLGINTPHYMEPGISSTTNYSNMNSVGSNTMKPYYSPIDLNCQTDSNHDTALTLACTGGHEELVSLLLSRGAAIEHRDKKGFTPLMLAASMGHAGVVEILLEKGSDLEAQSERTKDTALSLACSGGRYEVVETLMNRGANKEHRNVSDYTPLSLAASGGYVNIIKLLLGAGAEINSRTGSKLGISPLMLAAMNGHAAAVKLLLDLGSDINAQIETNRNTALTLACFQGRHEVVGLLLDRRANVEHRAKTGLTPLMEAASGGYVEVGRVLLDKGADVNAPPVPSSRDTALTIAADKGHYRFVELLLSRGALVDVKNKKGNSPLWLAANGGHLDVVQLLVNVGADLDSQDNRKITPLMAAFRKGHAKLVKWMVKHVQQLPSDQEMARYISTISDKELLKKCQQCQEILRAAKDRQAAEANKNATILLEELETERTREETRRAAAARRREKKRKKKKEKQIQLRAAKAAANGNKKSCDGELSKQGSQSEDEEEEEEEEEEDDDKEEEEEGNDIPAESTKDQTEDTPSKVPSNTIPSNPKPTRSQTPLVPKAPEFPEDPPEPHVKDKKRSLLTEFEAVHAETKVQQPSSHKLNIAKSKHPPSRIHSSSIKGDSSSLSGTKTPTILTNGTLSDADDHGTSPLPPSRGPKLSPIHTMSDLGRDLPHCDVIFSSSTHKSPSSHNSPKKGPKREEGWKEVTRNRINRTESRSKKVSVPANAISRVIGRGGIHINTIREVSGAHIEVEKQKGQGERTIAIRGTTEGTKQAHNLITALINESDPDIDDILQRAGLSKPSDGSSSLSASLASQGSIGSGILAKNSKSLSTSKSSGMIRMTSIPCNLSSSSVPSFTSRTINSIRPSLSLSNMTPPFPNMVPTSVNAWGVIKTSASTKTCVSITTNADTKQSSAHVTSTTKTTVSYTMAVIAPGKNAKSISSNTLSNSNGIEVISKNSTPEQLDNVVVTPNPGSTSNNESSSTTFPISSPDYSLPSSTATQVPTTSVFIAPSTTQQPSTCESAPEYTPFNYMFSKEAPNVWNPSNANLSNGSKPNFASVAASGITSIASQPTVQSSLPPLTETEPIVDAAKAPGYRGNLHISPGSSNLNLVTQVTYSSGYGAIGTGPRSAPCTPPLGPIAPPARPSIPSPPPLHSRSLPDAHAFPGELASFPMRFPLPPYPPSHTTTTYTQNGPLSSVGPLDNANLAVLQSNLNPNAPDFSSRGSLLMALQQPDFSPDNPMARFRPILGTSFPPHHPQQQTTPINRFQQNPSDFHPNGNENYMNYINMNMGHQFQGLPPGTAPVGMRPPITHRVQNASALTSSKDDGSPTLSPQQAAAELSSSSGTESPAINEDRKLPRPIGIERGQRKIPQCPPEMNPMWNYIPTDMNPPPPTAIAEWMNAAPPPPPQEEPSINNFVNRFAPEPPTMEQQQHFQMVNNAGFPPHFVNVGPPPPPPPPAPHLIYPPQHGTAPPPPHLDPADMWVAANKITGPAPDEIPLEHKIGWPSWSQHQA